MTYKYCAAISFLSEDEQLALRICERLERSFGLPAFVYSKRQQDLTGKTIEEALSPMFETQSRIVVVLYRDGWGDQGGTLVEYRAISRRRVRGDERFLFPIVINQGLRRPPWSDEIIYHDLAKYGFDDAVGGIERMYTDHVSRQLSAAEDSSETLPSSWSTPMVANMCGVLRAAFVTAPGVFRGYFRDSEAAEESKRWQSQGGEHTAATNAPKRPYYHTYWGYEAALRLDPTFVSTWAPVTLEAIYSHFGGGRWLKVVRDFSFSSGPLKKPELSETVRHTARAAELTYLLAPQHPLVSEVVWDLVDEASTLQDANGGWREFREGGNPPALWATVYVYRFLSKLKLAASGSMPDEREAFLGKVSTLLSASEQFLAEQWRRHRWELVGAVSWDEGTAAVLAEIGPFLSDESIVLDAYNALRSKLTPAGRLSKVQDLPGRPSETAYALRVAFGLKSCGRGLADADTRYRRLVAWLSKALVPEQLEVYDIAFAAAVLNLRAGTPRSTQIGPVPAKGDAGASISHGS